MATKFRRAPEVKEVADALIEELDRFSHLRGTPMLYMFRDQAQEKNGQVVWGTARKLTGLNALYARGTVQSYEMADIGGFADPKDWEAFEIMIAHDIWQRLDEHWRRWLVRHELSHCHATPDGDMMTVGHDIELFYSDAEGVESLGLTPRQFRDKFRDLSIAAFKAGDKQDDGATTTIGKQMTLDGNVDSIEVSTGGRRTIRRSLENGAS